MDIDVIYPLHNRLFYTQITFPVILHECQNNNAKLWIYDDNSTDGSSEFVQSLIKDKSNIVYTKTKIGNSTFCINETVRRGKAEWLYKVDNDIIIPDGAFAHMIENMPNDCGFMMMKECGCFPYINRDDVKIDYASHIGGVGLFRREAFDSYINSNARFFGFTAFQEQSKWKKARINSGNTNLDLCPWYNKSYIYTEKGWSRNISKASTIWP